MKSLVNRPFELSTEHLFRAVLVRDGAPGSARSVLFLGFHHIVVDGWSLDVLHRELGELYNARLEGRTPQLREPSVTIFDYARWRRRRLQGDWAQQQLQHWKELLRPEAAVGRLPQDRPGGARTDRRAEIVHLELSPSVAERAEQAARQQGTTLYAVLAAALAVVLHRVTGSTAPTIACPVALRREPALADVVGFFVNTVLVRVPVRDGDTVEGVLQAAKGRCADALGNADVPFNRVVAEVNEAYGRGALDVPVLLALQNFRASTFALRGVDATGIDVSLASAKYDLELAFAETPRGLRGAVVFRTSIFDRTTIHRLAASLTQVLEALPHRPEARIGDLGVLARADRHAVLHEFGPGAVTDRGALGSPGGPERFESAPRKMLERAHRMPGRVAVGAGRRFLTYGGLAERAQGLARQLGRAGIGPGDRVAILAEPGVDWVVALLAVGLSGAAHVCVDLSQPVAHVRRGLERAEVTASWVDPLLDGVTSQALTIRGVKVFHPGLGADALSDSSGALPSPTPLDVAYVVCTSGSTGEPKAVEITHGGLVQHQRAVGAFGISGRERVAQLGSPAFDAVISEVYLPLAAGAGVEIPASTQRADLTRVRRWLGRTRVTLALATPPALGVLGSLPSSLRTVVSVGDVLPAALAGSLTKGGHRVLNGYGPCEATACTTLAEIGELAANDRPSIGRPTPGAQVHVVDSALRLVGIGVEGELCVEGDGLALGYRGQPRATAAAFVPCPFTPEPGRRMYRTGDRGRWRTNGTLDFVGRRDRQVKIRGQRVELGAVEAAAIEAGASSSVAAVVVGIDSGRSYELVLATEPPADSERVRARMAQRVSGAMVPTRVLVLPRLPRTATGKIDRRQLEVLASVSSKPSLSPLGGVGLGEVETLAYRIVASELGHDELPLDADFFAVGGHSLLATRVSGRLQSELGVEVPISAVFEAPRIRDLLTTVARGVEDGTVEGEPLAPGIAGAGRPLSFAQERMWMQHLGSGPQPTYNMPAGLRLRGALDRRALDRALARLVDQHDVLRSSFPEHPDHDGRPKQRSRPGTFVPGWHDLEDCPERAPSLVQELILEPFDPFTGPLFRAHCIRLADEHHLLVLSLHHMVGDGWTVSLLGTDLARNYGGRPAPPELGPSYLDFSHWQRARMAAGALDGSLAYWREHLEGASTTTGLPTDRRRAGQLGSAGGVVEVVVPAELRRDVERLATGNRATTFMVLRAALHVLLWRLTGDDDSVVGSPVTGRDDARLQRLAGLLGNVLPIRVRGEGAMQTGRSLLASVRDASLGAYRHQRVPFDRIAAALGARSEGRNPLFDVMLSFQALPVAHLEGFEPLDVEPLPLELPVAKFELELVFGEIGDSLHGVVSFERSLFDERTIEHWLTSYVEILRAMCREPERAVAEYAVVDPTQQRALLRGRGTTPSIPGSQVPLPMRWQQQARARPGAIAIVFEGRHWSHGALLTAASEVARSLREHQIGAEDFVAVLCPPGPEQIIAVLGVLQAGAAYVPLDPELPAARLEHMFQSSGAKAMLHASDVPERVAARASLRLPIDASFLAKIGTVGGADGPEPGPRIELEQAAYVIFTSGTTGRPKGTVVSHRNLASLWDGCATRFDLGRDDVWTMFHALSFDFSVWEMWGALAHGARLSCISSQTRRTPAAVSELLERERVTVLSQTPSAFHGLAADVLRNDRSLSLRYVVFGGEALHTDRLRGWLSRFEHGPVLVNMYGITETTVHVTFAAIDRDVIERGDTIGEPLSHLSVQVLDPQLRMLPIGARGELFVGGHGVSRGYLGRPRLTASRFLPDPHGRAGGRLYRSGDLGRWRSDGTLEHLGRSDAQVKVRGFRIELGEIEAVLAEHPAVQDCVVTVELEEGSERLMAHIRWSGAEAPTEGASLRRWLAKRLPSYMLPSRFFAVDTIALTVNGKIDRQAVAASPRTALKRSEADSRDPRTPTESTLVRIYERSLGADGVGVEDDFFADLGGDSMVALHVVAAAREAGIHVSVADLFSSPSIRELANVAETSAASVEPTTSAFELLSTEQRERFSVDPRVVDAYPLGSLQHAMVFHTELDDDSTSYVDVISHRIRARYDVDVLSRSLQRLVDDNEMLRTGYDRSQADAPLQIVFADAQLGVEEEDLRALPQSDHHEAVLRWAERARRRRFDWAEPPLLRVAVHRLGADQWQMTWVVHHSILDGWSVASVLSEFYADYAARLAGSDERAPRGPAPVPYREVIASERRMIADPVARAHWRAEDPETERAPIWAPAGQNPPLHHDFQLSAPEVRRLEARARELRVPLRSVLLAAHAAVIGGLEGRTRPTTSVVVNTRPEREGAELTRGVCLNTVPVTIDLEQTWRDVVVACAQHDRDHQRYRALPIREILEEWRDARGGRELSAIPTVFNFVDFRVYGRLEGLLEITLEDGFSVEETEFALAVSVSRDPAQQSLSLRLTVHAAGLGREWLELVASHYARAFEACVASSAEICCRDLAAAGIDSAPGWESAADPGPRSRPPSAPADITTRLAAYARERGDAIAVVDGPLHLTYRGLWLRVHRWAETLRQAGVGAGDLVALHLERGAEYFELALCSQLLGAAFIPIPVEHPIARCVRDVDGVGADFVVSARLDGWPADTTGLGIDALRVQWGTASADSELASRPWHDGHLAYVLHTSGTSARPKGVECTRRGLRNLLSACADLGVDGSDRVSQFSSYAFDASVLELAMALCAGATLVLTPLAVRERVPELSEWLRRLGITAGLLTPTVLKELSTPPASFRLLLSGGEACTPDIVESCRTVPHFLNAYGPAENTVLASVGPPSLADETLSLGTASSRTELHVLGERQGPVLPGAIGELHIGGENLARGYRHLPRQTAARFRPDPFSARPGSRLYATGDLVRWRPDRTLAFFGRSDTQVKIRGQRIELAEIEAHLRALPAVSDALVRLHPSAATAQLVAFVASTEMLDAASLRRELAGRLVASMIPATWVIASEFPRTSSDKVDEVALLSTLSSQPDPSAELAPLDEVERVLMSIWSDVLQVERVGRRSCFFELGGHSILAARIMSRVEAIFAVRLPVRALFEASELSAFARAVRDAQARVRQVPDPASIERLPPGANVPLSPAQEALWFVEQLDGGGTAYLMPLVLRFRGQADVRSLASALRHLVGRHRALRTVVEVSGDEPRVRAASLDAFGPTTVDLRGLLEPAATLERAVERELVRPFVETAPLFRATLLRGHGHDVLVLLAHHIVADGWSLEIVVRDLAEAYRAAQDRDGVQLPPLAVEYGDYADWEAKQLRGAVFDRRLQYWVDRLSPLPGALRIPTDRPRPTRQSFRGAVVELSVETGVLERLRRGARRHGFGTFMLLLGAFELALHRVSGQSSVLVGTPEAGRPRRELEDVVGLFVSTVIHRGDRVPMESLGAWIRRLQSSMWDDLAHRGIPTPRIVTALGVERSLDRNPLYQARFVYQRVALPTDPSGAADISLDRSHVGKNVAKFDLLLSAFETDTEIEAGLSYAVDLFAEPTAMRILDLWRSVVVEIAAALEGGAESRPLASVGRVPMPQRHQQLIEWNDQGEVPPAPLVPERIEDWRETRPDAVAVTSGRRHLSRAGLDRAATAVARWLHRVRIGPEDVVGIRAERTVDLVVAILGVWKVGAAYLPLEADVPGSRMRAIMDASGARALLDTGSGPPSSDAWPGPRAVVRDLVRSESGPAPHIATAPRDGRCLAYVIATSGSTGAPKLVGVEHAHVAAYLRGALSRLRIEEPMSFAVMSTLAADLSLTSLLGGLVSGGRVELVSDAVAREPEAFAALMDRVRVDCVKVVPSHLAALSGDLPPAGRLLVGKRVILGGEAIPPGLLPTLRARIPARARIYNHYGPAEATVGVLACDVTHRTTPLTPMGLPFAGVSAHVLDPEGELAPIGSDGELYIGGASVTRGYLGAPRATAARFVPDPWSRDPGARLYRTGDRVRRLASGPIVFVGRTDDQVKIRGYRVEPQEVRAVLAEHPGVARCEVLARQRASGPELVAYVVPSSPRADGGLETKLRERVASRLTTAAIPKRFERVDAIPLTPNGKVDRRALLQLITEPPALPTEARPDAADPEVARRIGKIWREVLGVASVSSGDGFFALGGDSILAIRVVGKARRRGLSFTVQDMFEHQTLGELVAVVAQRSANAVAPVPIPSDERVPLLPLQAGFFERGYARPDHYNQAMTLVSEQRIELGRLSGAVTSLIRAHDALRLRFFVAGAGPVEQRCVPADPIAADGLAIVDLSALGPDHARRVGLEVLDAAHASLSLQRGPIARFICFPGSSGDALAILAHHLAVDVASWETLAEDLDDFYTGMLAPIEPGGGVGQGAGSFVRLAHLVHRSASAPELHAELTCWTRIAQARVPELPLSTGASGATQVEVITSVEETQSLLDESGVDRASLQEIVATALGHALRRWAKVTAVRIVVESRGRSRFGVDSITAAAVGWCTAIYPVVLGGEPDGTIAESLRVTKQRLREIPRDGSGWGVLRDLSPPEPRLLALRSMPVPSVLLNVLGGTMPASRESKHSLRPVAFPSGVAVAPQNVQHRPLIVTAGVFEGRLRMQISGQCVAAADVHAIASELQSAVRALSIPANAMPDPEGFSSSSLDDDELADLLDSIGAEDG